MIGVRKDERLGKGQGSGPICRGIRENLAGLAPGDLRRARLPSGRILIRLADIDGYLDRFCDSENRADKIVDEILREVRK